jgi:hypothetical protein
MTELERALVALGRELDFPPEPDLAGVVRARLERRPRRRRALAFAVALVVVAFGIAMAVPQARSAILDFFRIGSVSVQRVETLPAARERPLAAGLGQPLARHDAELRAHLPIRLPDLGGPQPTRYYARPGMIATLLQYQGAAVLLAEMRDDQVSAGKKFTAQATRVESVQLGRYGIWIEGGRHVLTWQFGPAEPQLIQTRLAGNVLIWLDGTTTYRLEGDLSKSQALKLAHEITR